MLVFCVASHRSHENVLTEVAHILFGPNKYVAAINFFILGHILPFFQDP